MPRPEEEDTHPSSGPRRPARPLVGVSPPPARARQVPTGRKRLRTRLREERGTVTAELALSLPGLILVLLITAVLAAGVSAHLRSADAASAAARAAAVGETPNAVHALVEELAGPDAQLRLGQEGRWAVAEVSSAIAHNVPGLESLEAHATARSLLEEEAP